jgi:thioredoxin-like negative regulator of GroEL
MIDIVDNDISALQGKTCLLLLYITASWCGPCQRIKPLLHKLSEGCKDDILEIYMVDIDTNDKLSEQLQVKSVPTFYLFKGTELQGMCTGADITKVHALLKEHLLVS